MTLRGLPRRSRITLVALTSLVLVLGVAVAAGAARAGADDRYRTATAATGTVTETVSTSGTVDANQRRDVATAVDGTVRRVAVEPGDGLRAGQLLLALDRTMAERAVRKARATLDQAKADLENAQDSQADAVESAAPSGGSDTGADPPAGADQQEPPESASEASQPESEPEATPPGGSDEVAPLPDLELPTLESLWEHQEAVTTAQTGATTALADSDTALAAQTEACSNAYGRGSTGAGTRSEEPAPDAAGGEPEPAAADDEANTACDAALLAVQEAQRLAWEKQTALQTTLDDLTKLLVAALGQTSTGLAALQTWITQQSGSAPPSTGGPGAPAGDGSSNPDTDAPGDAGGRDDGGHSGESHGQPAPTAGDTDRNNQGAAPSAPAAVNPSDLASASALSVAQAQASIDQARADLLRAQQDLAATRVVSPISGTVAAVEVAVGDTVATGNVAVTVIGDGGATVTLSLDTTEISKVEAGQSAEVTLPGATESVTGDVTWVSPVAAAVSSAFPAFARTSTYAAQVHVPVAALADRILPQGAGADVTIEVGASEGVLTVPTSAVVAQGSEKVVQVLGEDGPESKTVELGRVGPRRTEIVSGIEPGDEVVLADLDAEVDAAGAISTDASNGLPGPGGGRFPGGGRPGGFGGRPGR